MQKGICCVCEENEIKVRLWEVCSNCYTKLQYNKIFSKKQEPNCTLKQFIQQGFSAKEIVNINKFRKVQLGRIKQKDVQKQIDQYESAIKFLYTAGFEKKDIAKFCNTTRVSVHKVIQKSNILDVNNSKNEETIEIPSINLLTYFKTFKNTKPVQKTISSIGKSGTTPFKQHDITKLIRDQIHLIYLVYKKHYKSNWFPIDPILFIDCTAGTLNQNEVTSPSIFLETLQKYPELPARLYLIEKDPITFADLVSNYDKYYKKEIEKNPNLTVILKNEDFTNMLNNEIKTAINYQYGLLYFDPNGCKFNECVSLTAFLAVNSRMNTILNLNAGSLKRNRGAALVNRKGFENYPDFYISTILDHINRKNIWIRDNTQIRNATTHSKYEFVMIFGTNMETYKPINYNFVPLYSQEGQKFLFQYNYTKEEKEELLYENKSVPKTKISKKKSKNNILFNQDNYIKKERIYIDHNAGYKRKYTSDNGWLFKIQEGDTKWQIN